MIFEVLKMRYPDFLSPGGSIGYVAPSFGCNTEPYRSCLDSARSYFRSRGYGEVCGSNIYAGDGIGISSSPAACAAELTEAYLSDKSDVLFSVGGGELMCEILDAVPFDRISAAKPKWFMGYSDNTNFGFLLPTVCDVASVYGPCAQSFGAVPPDAYCLDAFSLICGEGLQVHGYDRWEKESRKDALHPLSPGNYTEATAIRSLHWDGQPFSGRFLGGCLDCLVNLSGTCFDHVRQFNSRYADDGVIWFLEACDLNIFAIRRALWQLQHTGWFENVKGFLIGRPLCMGQAFLGLDQYSAVTAMLGQYGVPVLMDVDLGHLSPMMPMINGGYGTVSSRGSNIAVQFELK